MMITMPIEERVRLTSFSGKVGRPISWIVREALGFYLPLAEAKVDQLQAEILKDIEAAGRGAGLTNVRDEARSPVSV